VLPTEAFPQKGYRIYNFTWYIFEWYSVKLSCGNHESFACVRQKFQETQWLLALAKFYNAKKK
jgi:hypothetical protein